MLYLIPKFSSVLNVWGVRLEISVGSTHLNLNGRERAREKQKNGKSVNILVLID